MNRLSWPASQAEIWPDFELWHCPETGSTMDAARLRHSAGGARGCVMADRQTAGRGRGENRRWEADAGSSLLCTFWLPLEDYSGQPPSLLAGVALLMALQSWQQELSFSKPLLQLKWPNDLLYGQTKLAGILCEASASQVYTGIGLNLLQEHFSGSFRRLPVSLKQIFGTAPDRIWLIAVFCQHLRMLFSEPGHWLDYANRHLAWRDKAVDFLPGFGTQAAIRGWLDSVDKTGAVLIRQSDRVLAYNSGELALAEDGQSCVSG